mmetsp:Transcript_94785/g.267594  ORF Transcript_94785/g.267594 Transcript_94785/m.267594 type:complete len:237 (-) Transcript_94785:1933-2643(-)
MPPRAVGVAPVRPRPADNAAGTKGGQWGAGAHAQRRGHEVSEAEVEVALVQERRSRDLADEAGAFGRRLWRLPRRGGGLVQGGREACEALAQVPLLVRVAKCTVHRGQLRHGLPHLGEVPALVFRAAGGGTLGAARPMRFVDLHGPLQRVPLLGQLTALPVELRELHQGGRHLGVILAEALRRCGQRSLLAPQADGPAVVLRTNEAVRGFQHDGLWEPSVFVGRGRRRHRYRVRAA